MANPRIRKLRKMQRLALHGQLDAAGVKHLQSLGLLTKDVAAEEAEEAEEAVTEPTLEPTTEPTPELSELEKVLTEVPEGTELVEFEVEVGEDEPAPQVDEELSYTEKRAQAIADKVAAKKNDDD